LSQKLRRKAKIQSDLHKSGFYKKPWIQSHGFKSKTVAHAAFYPSRHTTQFDRRKKTYTQPTHTHEVEKNIPETDAQ